MDQLVGILQDIRGIDGFVVAERQVESREFFLVGKEQDMNRAKQVRHMEVTLYRDFEAKGVRYKGSATVNIHPTMTEPEIRKCLEDTAEAAALVHNPYYELAQPVAGKRAPRMDPGTSRAWDWNADCGKILSAFGSLQGGWLNSAELFLERVQERIINSAGVDRVQTRLRGQLEFITVAQGRGEEVELYRDLKFTPESMEQLQVKIEEMRSFAAERARAEVTPALSKCPVIISGEPVREFFLYYYTQSSAKSVYEGISTFIPGQTVQGNEVRGDRIGFGLEPHLKGSTKSSGFDGDGLVTETVELIRDGRLLRYWGDNQYAQYMGVAPTGVIGNLVVAGGQRTKDELQSDPYLELLAFSDFQMDAVTGDFGGEIRLGRYFDGKRVIPVTGGSISGNIRDTEQEMYFSRELQKENNFYGPQAIRITGVAVTGKA